MILDFLPQPFSWAIEKPVWLELTLDKRSISCPSEMLFLLIGSSESRSNLSAALLEQVGDPLSRTHGTLPI